MRSLTNALIFGLLLLVGVFVLARRGTTPAPTSCTGEVPGPDCVSAPAVDRGPAGAPSTAAPEPTVRAEDVCPGAGYLCAGLAQRGIPRVMRWPDAVEEIEVRIPRPDFLDAAASREVQSAAVRGILAWQNSPFPIRVTRSDRPGSEDFVVSWSRRLNGTELGRTATRWELRDGVPEMQVQEFVLTTHAPWGDERRLSPRQIQLTAAHEMGHALGLPHSDERRDLMYPTNTATRLTTRDYLVMQALYGLENGAEILDEAR